MSYPQTLVFKNPVAAAAVANVGGTFANNGGPGDTITDTLGSALTVDTYAVQLNDRILLLAQTTGYQNGIYTQTYVAAVLGQLATLGTITGGTGYTAGTYTGVSLTGGSGTGAKATIVVSGGAVTTVTITTPGSGYLSTDTGLSAAAANIGGTGSGFSAPVGTVLPSWILTRATDANTSEQVQGMTILVSGGATKAKTLQYQSTYPVTLDVTSVITGTGTIVQPGTTVFPLTNGTYTNVPLTGGSGTNAGATIVVSSGSVASVTVTSLGSGYTNGNVLGFSGYGLGTGGTVVVTTGVPSSSSLAFSAI